MLGLVSDERMVLSSKMRETGGVGGGRWELESGVWLGRGALPARHPRGDLGGHLHSVCVHSGGEAAEDKGQRGQGRRPRS